jgi:hypothetical protein
MRLRHLMHARARAAFVTGGRWREQRAHGARQSDRSPASCAPGR